MKFTLAALLLFAFQVCLAQFTIKDVSDSTHRFIEIHSSRHPEIAKKIGQILKEDWGYDPASKYPFERVQSIEEADFSYSINAKNERVLSMVLQSSYSGCGLHITRYFYHFDSRTGASIEVDKLFTTDGLAKLKKALSKSFKDALKTAAMDKNDYHADEYKACLAGADQISEMNFHRASIMDGGIRFWAGSCLEGTTYEFEADRSQGPFDYSLGKLLPMLSAYGFSIFVNKSDAPLQTLMKGTVDGKYPVTMTLFGGSNGTVTGVIVYDRVGEPINVAGTMTGNQLVLHELDASNNPLSNIEVSWDGSKLTGSFINLKSKKQMPFVVK